MNTLAYTTARWLFFFSLLTLHTKVLTRSPFPWSGRKLYREETCNPTGVVWGLQGADRRELRQTTWSQLHSMALPGIMHLKTLVYHYFTHEKHPLRAADTQFEILPIKQSISMSNRLKHLKEMHLSLAPSSAKIKDQKWNSLAMTTGARGSRAV